MPPFGDASWQVLLAMTGNEVQPTSNPAKMPNDNVMRMSMFFTVSLPWRMCGINVPLKRLETQRCKHKCVIKPSVPITSLPLIVDADIDDGSVAEAERRTHYAVAACPRRR